MIPKIIHFIWLGENQIDKQSLICINAAKNNLPNYKIKIWNEQNLDLNSIVEENNFVKECLKRKLWAFVSDYLRLYILYKYGGIYLDTDVQVIKPFNNEMLLKSFIVGFEENGYIGTGLIAAERNNQIVKKLLDFYHKDIWNVDYFNNPIIFKHVLRNINLKQYNGYIYPREYFSPYSPNQKSLYVEITENTTCIHWYNANWGMSRAGYVFLQTKHYKNPVIKIVQILKKNIGYYKKLYFRRA